MIGDGPQLLTHYYDDARTMYQVFRRGLSISGERGHGGAEGLWQDLTGAKVGVSQHCTRGMAGEWCPGPEERSHSWPFSHPVGEVAMSCGLTKGLTSVLFHP